MPLLSAQTEGLKEIIIFFTSIAFVNNLFFFIYHSYNVKPKFKSDRLGWLSLFTILMTLIYLITRLFFEFYQYEDGSIISCKWRVILSYLTYGFSKFPVYILLMERLFRIFESSHLQFNHFMILISRNLLFFLWISLFISLLIIGDGQIINNFCHSLIPFWYIALFAFIDITICVSISILFSRRMWLLLSYSNMANKNYIALLFTLKKISILSMITCITTPTSIIFVAVIGGSSLWISMDSIINVWCIILMFKEYSNIFNIICSPLMNCISNKCLSYCSCQCFHFNNNHKMEQQVKEIQNDNKLKVMTKPNPINSVQSVASQSSA